MPPVRLQVVCDHRMLADVLLARLARDRGAFAVRHRRSVDVDLAEAVRTHDPAVTVVDARSVVGAWPALVDDLRAAVPDTRVVLLARTDDVEDAVVAGRRCLAAWLPPAVAADELVEVLHDVAAGHTVFPSSVLGPVLRRLVDDRRPRPPVEGGLAALTRRERDVLACLAAGRRDQEIADHLEMAANTVRTHTGRILRKLDVHSRLEAVRVAREHEVALRVPAPRGRRDRASAAEQLRAPARRPSEYPT